MLSIDRIDRIRIASSRREENSPIQESYDRQLVATRSLKKSVRIIPTFSEPNIPLNALRIP
jgi:hypothetical protein